jgi:hypothetical protein
VFSMTSIINMNRFTIVVMPVIMILVDVKVKEGLNGWAKIG